MPPSITYGVHAREMLRERGIEQNWVELTIIRPDFTERDPARADRIRAFRSMPERDGRVLRVVYVEQTHHVVTVFFDRSKSRRP